MVLGWAVSSTALIAIFFRDQPTPYFQDRKLVADVAADELSRDVATHHFGVSESPQAEDGVFQPVMTKYRVFAMLFCFLLMGVGMSGWGYGGDFDFSLEYTQHESVGR
ncbi:uncharacterized protein KRP23_5614 [Phytophthora ramorum]|uniref:uncharacterized protein n=1 Tax=Phytophthora ramorum TaxID=164328 RepID=UPI0030B32F1A|nr:hypothetical protein KRP23_5611 [Phytophthora ramorum]KAH7482447.1 hypothetical protein KRP23_5614 [Phytophthora ramorum]